MKLKKNIAGHLLALALVFPHSVLAEDFTFNVGVDLKNIHPDIAGTFVSCKALQDTSELIGSGSKDVIIDANGNVVTTVQIKFNARPGKNPGDANLYRCDFRFLAEFSPGSVAPSASDVTNCNDASVEFSLAVCAEQGTPFTPILTGTIP